MKKFLTALSLLAVMAAPLATHAALPSNGTLIKASGSAVYWYSKDGKRYVFPNEKTYFSWYADFSGVRTVTDAELASVQLGGNVTYKPGVKMVKIQSDPRTYAVDTGGVLRWVTSEAIASQLYGADWNKKIDDLSDAFFINYTLGADITSASQYSPSAAAASVSSIDDDLGVTKPPSNPPPPPPAPAPVPAPQGTTEAGLIIAGAQNEVLARFWLTAADEELELVKVRIALLVPASARSVLRMRLYDGTTLVGGPVPVDSSGNADFTGVTLIIPRNGSKTMTVAADLDTIANGARSNDDLTVKLHVPSSDDGTYELRGTGTNTVLRSGSGGDVDGNQKILRKTAPTISDAALPTTALNDGDATVSRFSVAADAAEQVSLKKLTFSLSKSNAIGITAPVLRETGVGSNITAAASLSASCAAGAGTTCTIALTFASEQVVSAGAMKKYDLHVTVSGSGPSTSIVTTLLGDSVVAEGTLDTGGTQVLGTPYHFIWSDNSAVPHNDNDAGSADWTNGTYVQILPNDAQALTRS